MVTWKNLRRMLLLSALALFVLALVAGEALALNPQSEPPSSPKLSAPQQAPALQQAPARMKVITDTLPAQPPKAPSAYPIAPWKGTPGGAPPLPKGVEGMNKAEGMQKVVMPKPGGEGGAIAPSDMPKSGLAYEGIDGESAVGTGGPAAESGAPSSIRGKQQGELGVLVEPKAEP